MPANQTAALNAEANPFSTLTSEADMLEDLLNDLQLVQGGADEVVELVPEEVDASAAPASLASAAPFDETDEAELNNLLETLPSEADEAAQVEEPGAVTAHDTTAEPEALVESGAIEDIEAAVEDAEREAAKVAMYAAQPGDNGGDGSAPLTTAESLENPPTIVPVDAKVAKAAAAAAKKAEKAAAKAAADAEMGIAPKEPKAPKAPSAPRATSVTHKPGALLIVKLGSAARDYLTFDMADIELDAEALYAKQDAFIARMNDRDAIADKVREKMTMLLTWIQKGGELNTVLHRTFMVLHAKNELTSGDAGNLQVNLLAKPYSLGTARSQANQMFMALPELGIVVKEKGRMVPNPNSTLLPLINAKLGLV